MTSDINILTRREYRRRNRLSRYAEAATPGSWGLDPAVDVASDPVWDPAAVAPAPWVWQEPEEDAADPAPQPEPARAVVEEGTWESPQDVVAAVDAEADVPVDDPLPEPPAAFTRIREVIAKMFDRSRPDAGTPDELLDADTEDLGEDTDGDGQWWDEPDTTHELTVEPTAEEAPHVPTGEDPVDTDAGEAPALTAKEERAQRKAEAKAAAQERAAQKKATQQKSVKQERVAEKKRLAIAARETATAGKRAQREALEEEKVEQDEAKSRTARERKAQEEWKKKQKRRAAIKLNGGKEGFWQGTSKPKPLDIANAIRSLAIILETSPAEVDAVKMMAEEFAGNRIGDAFDRIYTRLVKDNATLVEAFEPEEVFPAVVHNMLRVGAKTAKPGPALRTAVELMDSGNDNARKMRNAVREPLVVAVLSLGILFGTAYFVVPTFLDMYKALKMPVGVITGFVVTMSTVSIWVIGIGGVLALAYLIWWFAVGRSSLRVRVAMDRWKLHAPLIGKSEQTGESFQMFNILNSYLSVGATEREALLNTATAMQNRAVKRHLRTTANGLTRGEKTFAQFLDDEMFPRLARSILATGQRTGQTVQVVKNLRDIYENESKIEGEQAVEKVVGVVSALSSVLFTVTATIVSIPPLEIFGATLGYSG